MRARMSFAGFTRKLRFPDTRRAILWSGCEPVRAYPDALLGTDSGELFERAADNWPLEGWLAQLGWMRSLGHEGGLFVTVGQRT